MAKRATSLTLDELKALVDDADDMAARLSDISERATKDFGKAAKDLGKSDHYLKTSAAMNRLIENAAAVNRALLGTLEMQDDANELRDQLRAELDRERRSA